MAVLLFGSVNAFAFESYETYTYSIDGEPLKSPQAYTPDFTTYDSEAMGLVGGHHWGFYDSEIGIWEGNAMHPITYDYIFTKGEFKFVLNGDGVSYSVAGLDLENYITAYASILTLFAEYGELYAYPDDADAVTEIEFSVESVEIPEDTELTMFNYLGFIKEALDKQIEEAKAANPAGQPLFIYFADDEAASAEWLKMFEIAYADKYIKNIEIPETYEDLPVTGILSNAFSAGLPADFNSSSATYTTAERNYYLAKNTIESKVYATFANAFIPESVTSLGENIFATSALEKIFYFGDAEAAWSDDEATANTVKEFRSIIHYYSDSAKYGNNELALAKDLVSDKDGNLYIVDQDNNRVVVLNKRDFKVIGAMGKYVDEYGNEQSLNKPSGVFVTNPDEMVESNVNSKNYKGGIFVCDTANKRIVVFDHNFEYMRTIEEPTSGLLDNDDFELNAIAVDIYGRIFTISHNCHEGVMVLSSEGEFTGFIGAQKVTVDPIQQLWNNLFKDAEDLRNEEKDLPEPFNNITVDNDGFVYVTINFTKPEDIAGQLTSITEKTAAYSPVKKLNSTGVEIMKRNGFFDPGGEVIISATSAIGVQPSTIVDIAIGNEGSWSILDSSRSRIFTYDSNGNLLFAFGDNGDMVGNGEAYVAMTYQVVDGVYNLVLLDKPTNGNIIIYHPTEYCDAIMSALHNENVHNHQASIDDWREVLKLNNNFDLAYIGIGKALYNLGEYEEAMEMLSSAYETEYYAKAFAERRKQVLSTWMIPLIIGIIVVLILFFKFLGWAKKKNKATSLKVGRKSYVEELLYAFHLVFHPFDGFWDLKHEKRGSVRAGTTILGITVVAFFYQAIGQGYMFNPRGDYSTVFLQVIAVLVPVLLWVISNWCLTTLFDGEGSLKDIYIATTYSLAPLPLFIILSTILSNVFTISEGSMVTLLVAIGYIWVGLLLFFGMSVTHDYPTGKNVITVLGTIVAMAVIMFIAILFSSLVIKMVSFIISICTEIIGRF